MQISHMVGFQKWHAIGRHGLRARLAAMMVLCTGLFACGEAVYDTIQLMPPPAVYLDGEVDPFPLISQSNFQDQTKLFYVTDRRPATEGDKSEFYANERAFALRGGAVRVQADPPFKNWEEVRAVSLTKDATKKRLLRVNGVDEFGFLPVESISVLPDQPSAEEKARGGKRFAADINKKLASSVQKDIFIYVHGYNVDFDYPILASKEVQHYLGCRGAFITYAWPATPNRLAYFKDLETADSTRKNLREFILFLSRNTTAKNIHIIGYSAGSRLAFEAVYDLALKYPMGSSGAPRLGQVILIGSDVDRSYFAQALDDGVLDSTGEVIVYMSSTDAALRMSSIVLGQDRLGQVNVADDGFSLGVRKNLRTVKGLTLIDVSDAEGSSFGNGHSYFRSSPWASSDMFVSLIYGIDAQARGLVRGRDDAYWSFPDDYPDRIVEAVKRLSR